MFITFEGGEGSGKTTVIKKLFEYLTEKGYQVIQTREPGGSFIAEQIRGILLDKKNTEITAETEALLFAAARAQHINEVIIPNLDKLILCDRYLDSSIAYQAFGRELGLDFVQKINSYAYNYLPTLTFFLKLDPEDGNKRVKTNRSHKLDRLDLETSEFHQRVARGYQYIANQEPKRFLVVDATLPKEEIFELILQKITEVL